MRFEGLDQTSDQLHTAYQVLHGRWVAEMEAGHPKEKDHSDCRCQVEELFEVDDRYLQKIHLGSERYRKNLRQRVLKKSKAVAAESQKWGALAAWAAEQALRGEIQDPMEWQAVAYIFDQRERHF